MENASSSSSINDPSKALIIMEPPEGDSNVLLLKDMMLDEQEQQCVLEVYSEAPDEFILPDNFPDEIHIDINLDQEDGIPYFEETAVLPKRVTAANHVLPLLTSVYEDKSQEEEIGLSSEWREVLQALSSGVPRDNCSCSLCGCIFVSPSKLLSHAVEVHSELDLKGLQHCFVCRKSYIFPASLSRHLEQHHGLPLPQMTCSVCFTQLNSRSELKAHERKHELTESCKKCFGKFASRHLLTQHTDTAHAKSFPCSNCRAAFNHQVTARMHMNRHAVFANSSCAKCGWRPIQMVDPELGLLEHLHLCQSAEELQTFLSSIAEEDRHEFELEPLLKNYHQSSLINENDFSLLTKSDEEKCLLGIVSAVENVIGSFACHQIEAPIKAQESFCKLCTKLVSRLDQIPEHVQECHPKSRQCPICKKRFPSVKRAQNHTNLHFPEQKSPPKEIRCQYCEKVFKEMGKLNRHVENIHSVKLVERPFDCHLCGKQFQSAVIRDRHLVTHSAKVTSALATSAPAPIKCSYCSSTFIKASYLSKHTEKYHSSIITESENHSTEDNVALPFLCKTCGVGLESFAKLKRHMLFRHGAASVKHRFKCSVCSVGCRTAVGLKVHMRTHTNERPHACQFCEKTFVRAQALTEHRRRMHEEVDEQPLHKVFCCSEKDCTVKNAKHAGIMKHFLRAHRNFKRFICGRCGESYCQNQELKIHAKNKHNLCAPNVVIKETSKQTDIYVFPPIYNLSTSDPHLMLISQIVDDQRKKTENIPNFACMIEEIPAKKSKFERGVEELQLRGRDVTQKVNSVLQSKKKQLNQGPELDGETIIYDDSGVLHPVVPDLEAIAAPNTEGTISLTTLNNETFFNILNKAYEKIKPQYSEMVAVVNLAQKESGIAVVSVPVEKSAPFPAIVAEPAESIVIEPKTDEESTVKTEKLSGSSYCSYPFKCDMPDCGKVFGDSTKLMRHKKTHSSIRPYECATCLKTFREKGNLVVHMRSHSKEKPYSCDQCSKSYRYLQEFKRHKLEHSGEKFTHMCPLCPGKVFKHSKDLSRHKRVHENDAPSFECNICGTILARKDTLLLHMARKHRNEQFKCGICNKIFTHEQQLKLHKTIHSGTKEHKCEICGRTFALRSYLCIHLKRHEKQKKYVQCTMCPRKFSSQKIMEVHISTFHAKGAMLHKRQQKQEELQRQDDARRAALASALEEEMLHVDFDLDDDPNSQIVYLQVLSDADLALLPS